MARACATDIARSGAYGVALRLHRLHRLGPQPIAKQEPAQPRHLVARIKRDGVMRRRTPEPLGPVGIVAEGSAVAQKVAPRVPKVEMQRIRLGR